MKIIVDAMGGDNAPQAPVMGAIQANKEYGVGITLVGRGEDILKVLEENGIRELPAGVEIAHASEVVEICDNPATAFREKKDSSLTVGLNLLKAGEGDAFVSAGSTGALLGAATLLIKRIRGIRRAALAPVVPTGNGGAVLIDAGANVKCPPEYLIQFAYMGSYYAEHVLGRPQPKVGLLNIGVEPSKGTELQTTVYPLLKQAGEEGRICFVGNIIHRGPGSGGGRGGCHRGRRLFRKYFSENHGGDRPVPRQGDQGYFCEKSDDQAGCGPGLRRAEEVQEADELQRGGRDRPAGYLQAGDQGPRLFRRLCHQKRHPPGQSICLLRDHWEYLGQHRPDAAGRPGGRIIIFR